MEAVAQTQSGAVRAPVRPLSKRDDFRFIRCLLSELVGPLPAAEAASASVGVPLARGLYATPSMESAAREYPLGSGPGRRARWIERPQRVEGLVVHGLPKGSATRDSASRGSPRWMACSPLTHPNLTEPDIHERCFSPKAAIRGYGGVFAGPDYLADCGS
jgi:hypothetical protein